MRVYAAKVANAGVRGYVRDLRPVWLLEELGVAYETVWLDRARDENRQPSYLAINPLGKVPAIDDDGFKLYESAAICIYLGEKFGRLIPKSGTRERAIFDQWVFSALTNVEPVATRLFAADRFLEKNETPTAIHDSAVAELQRLLPVIDRHLAGRPHVLGADFSIADIILCTVLRLVDGNEALAPQEHISTYLARLQSRPAFRRALAVNGGPPESAVTPLSTPR
jgi:glutathione S-transferase